MSRAAIVLHHDADNQVDTYIPVLLDGLRAHVDHVLVVVNGTVSDRGRAVLDAHADEVLVRNNHGLDVAAYVAGLDHLGWGAVFDEIVCTNTTVFGPVGSFDDVFAWAEARPHLGFWGITDHAGGRNTPGQAPDYLVPPHVQSYWIAMRQELLADPHFPGWMRALSNTVRTYDDSVRRFEHQFTRTWGSDYQWGAVYSAVDYPRGGLLLDHAEALLERGCPVVKRRVFFHHPPFVELDSPAGARMLQLMAARGYDPHLVTDSIARVLADPARFDALRS